MDDYMQTLHPMEGDQPTRHSPSNIMRIAAQVAGLVLIVVGGCYALVVVSAVLNIARNPGGLTPLLGSMAKAIGLDEATVPAGQGKIPIGRAAACVILISWYQITAWVALRLVATGGQLVMSAAAERREFLAAMKQMAANTHGNDRSPQ